MTLRSSSFKIRQGNNLSPKFTYKLNGVAQDIKNAKLYFALANELSDDAVLFTLKNSNASGNDTQISWVGTGDDGEFYVHLLPIHTTDLTVGTYWWEIKMDLNGVITTIGQNKLEVIDALQS